MKRKIERAKNKLTEQKEVMRSEIALDMGVGEIIEREEDAFERVFLSETGRFELVFREEKLSRAVETKEEGLEVLVPQNYRNDVDDIVVEDPFVILQFGK